MQRMDNRTERIFSMLAYRYLRNRHDEVLFVVTVSLMRNTALVDLLNLCLRTNTVG